MSASADFARMEERVANVAHMLNSLAGIVSRLNVETHLDTTSDRLSSEQRQRAFSDIDEEIKTIQGTLGAWLKQWDEDA